MFDAQKRVWWVEWASTYDGTRAVLTDADAIRYDGGRRLHASSLEELFELMNNEGATFVFVYDMSFFGMFCDLYAARKGLKPFKDAEKRAGGHGAAEPCFSTLYGGVQGVLSFRLTIPRTKYTHTFRGGKVGGLHTVEYRGIAGFINESHIAMIESAFGAEDDDALERGRLLLHGFAKRLTEIVGEDILEPAYAKKVYTIGGAAKRLYLRTRYGRLSVAAYHREHDASEAMDDFLRARRLLLGGMCFFPSSRAGKLYERPLKKYDVNGLYMATAVNAGELSYPREATPFDFETDRDPSHVYIAVVKDLVLIRRDGMPPCFDNPFSEEAETESGDFIEVRGELALFRELFEALHRYYIFENFEFVQVLRMQRTHDDALDHYGEQVVAMKDAATARGDEVLRSVAKMFSNALFGKFSQKTRFVEVVPVYEEATDSLTFLPGEEVDNWERGHFDFVRGAYIYTMARVRMMNDIADICAAQDGVEAHHYYTDTDSIVTDAEMPAEMLDPVLGGKYKVEREYSAFGVLSKKCYYARLADGMDELVAAGVPRGLVTREIHERYGDGLTAAETFEILTSGAAYTIHYPTRTSGGGAVGEFSLRVKDIDLEDFRRF